MSARFEGSREIGCDIGEVKRAVEDLGELYVEIVKLMPGMTSVELVDQGQDSVVIRTNEGLMKRTNISKHIEADRVVVEFDEGYEAGSKVTVTSHVRDEFTSRGAAVVYHLVTNVVEAPGFLGFLYRTFGVASTGKAFLNSYKTHLERPVA